MPNFYVLRLGRDSVNVMRQLDALTGSPEKPIEIEFCCKQVPLDATPGSYLFIWLGSDNSKGQPTDWKKGLRALGRLKTKDGGPNYNDQWTLGIEIGVVLPQSINQHDLLDSEPAAYSDFSNAPILGLSVASQQAVQQIRTEEARQSVAAILYSIEQMNPGFRSDVVAANAELESYFNYVPKGTAGAGPSTGEETEAVAGSLSSIVDAAHAAFVRTNLIVDRDAVERLVASLLAKRFLILTGLSGSGKTKLAQGLACWITSSHDAYAVVSVGADWTNSDPILGYPDALNPGGYIRTPALDLIFRAISHPDEPHFLILDEMNLSHVERYFAPILSAIESNERIHLHDHDDIGSVPQALERLPNNLFVIGTVNIDETTYLFSPKVLDRANVMEFRVTSSDLSVFLESPKRVMLEQIATTGSDFAEEFLSRSNSEVLPSKEVASKLRCELRMYFDVMYRNGSEFGYRTAFEIGRFLAYAEELAPAGQSIDAAIDSQILQKLLPRIHGARREIEPLLRALGGMCYVERNWQIEDGAIALVNESDVHSQSRLAMSNEEFHPTKREESGEFRFPPNEAWHPKSFGKIQRMLLAAEQNGFASFAEA